jgi:hypothetical protein
MKNDPELWSAGAGGVGALLRALKNNSKLRGLIINSVIGLFLGFVVIQGLFLFLSEEDFTIQAIIAIAWVIGFLSNSVVDKLDDLLDFVFLLTTKKMEDKFDVCKTEENPKEDEDSN